MKLDEFATEILLQIASEFKGSDLYGLVLVNRHFNALFTAQMYRELKLVLPEPVDDSDGLVDLFERLSVDCTKGSGALLKRTFKETTLSRAVKVLTVVGRDLESPEYASVSDSTYKGVRNLVKHLTCLHTLAFQGDSAQLSAFIYSVSPNITSLSLDRLSRIQFGDVYTFKTLKRLSVRALQGQQVTNKSAAWETLYAIRMLLEQNASSLERVCLANWDFDMLFHAYAPRLLRLSSLTFELESSTGANWTWFPDLVSPVRPTLKVYICSENLDESLSRLVDWKALQRIGRRVKRKSVFKGHVVPELQDSTSVVVELTIKRQRQHFA
ncbi:hypothetical protein V1512DRAFT_293307 [Lipomyces arxii]|uniref:uncharacterized protein n=1 Tax=Lipomyces arxii TaxID=56418 RepID=UPI0034CF9108